jgi:hypothetical protein
MSDQRLLMPLTLFWKEGAMASILVQAVDIIRKKTSCIKRTNWSKLWDSGDRIRLLTVHLQRDKDQSPRDH